MTGRGEAVARPVFLATGPDVTGAEPPAGEGTLANRPSTGVRTVSTVPSAATPTATDRAKTATAPAAACKATGARR